jgi:hypothetical protein
MTRIGSVFNNRLKFQVRSKKLGYFFEKKVEKHSVKGLMHIEPIMDESLSTFMVRFNAYRSQLGNDETRIVLARAAGV